MLNFTDWQKNFPNDRVEQSSYMRQSRGAKLFTRRDAFISQ